MPNQRIVNHGLEGTEHVYRPDLPPYDASAPDEGPGALVLANGMWVHIVAVFMDWNGVPGLDMLYVRVPETGMSTHVTPADLHIGPLTDTGHLPFVPEVPC